jgi:hypothetical protein
MRFRQEKSPALLARLTGLMVEIKRGALLSICILADNGRPCKPWLKVPGCGGCIDHL